MLRCPQLSPTTDLDHLGMMWYCTWGYDFYG